MHTYCEFGDVAPFISVVIPLYNKADSVMRAVSSAASQIDADFEIIVVDDGSTDSSAELVKIARVPRLRLIEQANAGASAARNSGIAAAEGKWIALLDADDCWSRDHLAGLLKAVEGSDVIAGFSNIRLQSRAGEPLVDPDVPAQKINDYFSFALSNGGYPISSSSIMALRDQLLAAGCFAEGIPAGEDIDMWCRLACRGPFAYTARLSSTYNDEGSPTRFGERSVFPIFAQRFPELVSDGRLPAALVDSGRRYVNFLMLEYARQLIDAGKHSEARIILLQECVPGYDTRRFLKRLARTTSLGRALYRLLQDRVEES
jgi:glycosyltransferase involved in cell wall biosynthesis